MKLVDSIYNHPEEWVQAKHTLNHKDGAKIWTANGAGYCLPYPSGIQLGFWNRRKLWKAVVWWNKNASVTHLGKHSHHV